MVFKIMPYRAGSRSVRSLADALGCKRLRYVGSRWKGREGVLVINWGNGKADDARGVLNQPSDVSRASNKLSFFERMKEAGQEDILPPFWTDDDIPLKEYPIVCRQKLTGHSGEGIVIADNPDEIVPARLYVKYMKKKDEYRIHVGYLGDEYHIISQQKKVRRLDTPDDDVDWQVRNHKNGFNFARQDIEVPSNVIDVAKKALFHSGLQFGAVDVIWNQKKERATVLEINTAPGLEGQTIQDYAEFFKMFKSKWS